MKILKALIGGPTKLSMKMDCWRTSILSVTITCKQNTWVQHNSTILRVLRGYSTKGGNTSNKDHEPQPNSLRLQQKHWTSWIAGSGDGIYLRIHSGLTKFHESLGEWLVSWTAETRWQNHWDIYILGYILGYIWHLADISKTHPTPLGVLDLYIARVVLPRLSWPGATGQIRCCQRGAPPLPGSWDHDSQYMEK